MVKVPIPQLPIVYSTTYLAVVYPLFNVTTSRIIASIFRQGTTLCLSGVEKAAIGGGVRCGVRARTVQSLHFPHTNNNII